MQPRELNPDDWKTAAIDHQKDSLGETYKKFGQVALHHKISRNKLSTIGEALAKSLPRKDWKKAREGAIEFWNAVKDAVPSQVIPQVEQAAWPDVQFYTKVLWNMPVNLEAGPLYVYEDVGVDFDPNTLPLTGGSRQIEPSSGYLKELLDIFWTRSNSVNGLNVEAWQEMAAALNNAVAAHGGSVLKESLLEQWWPAGPSSYFKKGLRHYHGLEACEDKFNQARFAFNKQSLLDEIKDLEDSEDLVFDEAESKLIVDGKTIDIYISKKTLFHICERHTYRYFNFGKRIQPINTFWPEEVTIDNMKENLKQAFPAIASVALFYGENGSLNGIKASNVQGEQMNFFIIFDLDVQDDWLICTVGTIAPDGEGVSAYTEDELKRIKTMNRL